MLRMRGGNGSLGPADEFPMPEQEGQGGQLAKRMIPILEKNLKNWLSLSRREG